MSATIDIDCAPEDVWAFVMDVRNDPKWRTGVVESGLLTPTPLAVGSKGYARAERGEACWLVRSLEPGRSVDWELTSGPITDSGGYRVEPCPTGTRFTLVADVAPTGLLRAIGPLFTWIGRRQNRADVQKLKRLLEPADESRARV